MSLRAAAATKASPAALPAACTAACIRPAPAAFSPGPQISLLRARQSRGPRRKGSAHRAACTPAAHQESALAAAEFLRRSEALPDSARKAPAKAPPVFHTPLPAPFSAKAACCAPSGRTKCGFFRAGPQFPPLSALPLRSPDSAPAALLPPGAASALLPASALRAHAVPAHSRQFLPCRRCRRADSAGIGAVPARRYRSCSCRSCRRPDWKALRASTSSPAYPPLPPAADRCCAQKTPRPARTAPLRAATKTAFRPSGASDPAGKTYPSPLSFRSSASHGMQRPDTRIPESRRIFRPARAQNACARSRSHCARPCAAARRTLPSKTLPACFFRSRFPGRSPPAPPEIRSRSRTARRNFQCGTAAAS